MLKSKRGKKSAITAMIVVFVLLAGFGGYCLYGTVRMNALSEMSFEDMLAYTTKNQKDAIITVGIVQNGKATFNVYGENSTLLPPIEHIYEIGSITKTFTTTLLCKAISEGKADLDDSVDRYLNLPCKSYYPTIERLVTHTSGYKGFYFERPMISNFFNRKNDFYRITEDMVIERLGKINLDDRTYPFKYSNFGMAVLGILLEKIYGEDYTKLMNDYILEDLDLSDTVISNGSGDLEHYWDWADSDAYLSAGAILSDISDMMKYAEMQMNEVPGYFSLAHNELIRVNATTAIYEKTGIRIDGVGMGWMLDLEHNIIWHNGGTGHYNSYIGFDNERQIAVVILSNLPPNFRIPATVTGARLLTSLQMNH